MTPTLRRWQGEAVPAGLASLESGQPGLIVATTGAGKSVVIAEILRRWTLDHPPDEGAVVVATPTRRLVEQLAGTLGEVLGHHRVGKFYTRAKQDRREVVVVCNPSVPLLAERFREQGRSVQVLVLDEAHKAEGSSILADDEGAATSAEEVVERLGAKRRLGLTATPFRSDTEERLSLFDKVVYRYPPAEALRDGVIVPWRFVPWTGAEDTPIDTACIAMIRALGDRAARGPGVVNASNIADAESYAGVLTAAGIMARPLHSRMAAADQDRAVAELRDGALDCLVHVSMLVEGVDYPWLRWGCFRREVGARVRFIQELGRYLRAAPGKTEAVLLDPHGLESVFDVAYAEALGWEEPEATAKKSPDGYDAEKMAEPEAEPRVLMARRVDALSRYVRQLHLALIAEGICAPARALTGTTWRDDPASEKQAGALRAMVRMASRLGPEHREALGKIAARPVLTKGLASDGLDLLQGVRRLPGGKVWTPPVPIAVPPAVAFEAVRDPVTYVAGAMRNGRAAVGIIRDGAVLYVQARPTRRGDTWSTLTRAAVDLARARHGAQRVACSMQDVATATGATVCPKKDNPAERVVWRELAKPVPAEATA